MNLYKCVALLSFLSCCSMASEAQSVQVNQQNRTIEIAASSSVEVTADLVTITVGYHNYGPTHDVAFAENVRTAAAILKAWKDVGVPDKDISTNSLTSRPTSEDELGGSPPADRKQKQYVVDQSWKITRSVEVAQKLLDIAVDAGANDVGEQEWHLADPNAAEAQAYTSALEKARSLANQIAKSLGAKIGSLLYVSNESRASNFETANVEASSERFANTDRKVRPETKLLPQKVEKSGYVRAIFALE